MSSARCAILFGALLLAGSVSTLRALEIAPAAPEPPLMPPAGKSFDPWKLPADGLIEIKSDKLQELYDEIARLKGKLKTPPARCRLLNGRVEDGFVLFKVEFDFRADRPDAVIGLACSQAKVKAAQQEGRTPLLSADADGFMVQVEKPGDYTVTLDVSLPLFQRAGGGRGFELNLPRAVVTLLEMDLPADARAPHVNGKDLTESSLTFKNNRLEGPLGAESKLELTWQVAPPASVTPLQTVRARVEVRVEDGGMTTNAELILHPQVGPMKQWVVIAPPGFEVKASAADQPRIQSIISANEQGAVRTTVQLKDPGDADLTLTATAPKAPLAPGKRAAVGPFLVRGASRQSGVVLVSVAGPNAGVVLHPHADLSPRDLTDDERRADPGSTAYEYGSAPLNQPWLEVEAGSAPGPVKTQSAYTLTLGRGAGGALEWQVKADFTVAPGGDHLDVSLPSNFEFLAPAPDEGEKVEPGKDRTVHLKLAKDATGLSKGSVKGRYTNTLPLPAAGKPASLSLSLPRPVATRDAVPQIDVITSDDDIELLPPADAEMTIKEIHKLRWFPRELSGSLVISWKPYRPEMHVASVIDVTLHSQNAVVLHELHLHFPRTAPKQVTLTAPESVAHGLEVLSGGFLVNDAAAAPGSRTVKLQGAGQDQTVILKYSFPTPEKTFDVPLAVLDQATDGEAHIRVWCDLGRLPQLPGGDWSEQGAETVQGDNRLPALVLTATRPDAPLRLTLGDPSNESAKVLIDRALIRAVYSDGAWEIRASYLVRQLADPGLEVDFPEGATKLKATFARHVVDPQLQDASGQSGANRRRYHLRLATTSVQWPTVLELAYWLEARRASEAASPAALLQPPVIDGDLKQAPTRWQVTLPSDPAYVPLAPEGGAATRWTLGWRGWLPAPGQAVVNADLERWFAGADVSDWPEGTAEHPSLVCWQDAGQPITVVAFPEWGWFAICSLTLIPFGMFLFSLARRGQAGRRWPAFWFWLIVMLLVPAIAALWVFRPTMLYAIGYGCEPGAVVLLVMLLLQALRLERYRRQIVFLPNFRRARIGSSLVRANGSHRPAGEPSTIDAPRAAGSSQQPV